MISTREWARCKQEDEWGNLIQDSCREGSWGRGVPNVAWNWENFGRIGANGVVVHQNWPCQSSGGSRISPRRGAKSQGGAPTYDFVNFCRNCMKMKKFGARGGARPLRHPLDPPLQRIRQTRSQHTLYVFWERKITTLSWSYIPTYSSWKSRVHWCAQSARELS